MCLYAHPERVEEMKRGHAARDRKAERPRDGGRGGEVGSIGQRGLSGCIMVGVSLHGCKLSCTRSYRTVSVGSWLGRCGRYNGPGSWTGWLANLESSWSATKLFTATRG